MSEITRATLAVSSRL